MFKRFHGELGERSANFAVRNGSGTLYLDRVPGGYMKRRRPVIDLTMGLLNRTAVYDIGLELSELRPDFRVRYWRWLRRGPIYFGATERLSFLGKAMGRLALKDIASSIAPAWPRGGASIVFVDPIFTVKTHVLVSDIVICHDVAPISHPEYYDPGAGEIYNRAYRRIQASRPAIIFVSEVTKRLFLDLYPADYRYTKVVPLYFRPGLDRHTQSEASAPTTPYFLMVGGMERRKNFVAAIEAFRASGLVEQGYHLYISGPRGNLSADLLPKLAGDASVTHLGYVDTDRLAALYRGATALFFPSLIEGFGVPALEATRLGTIAIVSAGTVLEEVVGPNGVTVDPENIADMAAGLRRVADMTPTERSSQIAVVAAHQARFSIDAFRASWSMILGEA